MKPKKHSSFVAFLTLATTLAGSSVVLAQVADLPIKPGLWEADVSVKSGATNIDSGPEQLCFSAGMTLGAYVAATNHGPSGTRCDVTNKVVTPQEISYDTVCTGPHTDARGHAEVHLTDGSHFHGTSHMTTTGSAHGKSTGITIDKTFTAKFLKPDCGNVKPMAVPTSKGA